mmetsp:Transcript_90899/g.160975  ORF Transcript_90899/g.160975 Transcript_90899/m.160975 type:complete len:129 (-) Transcript_90899:65-451(-)
MLLLLESFLSFSPSLFLLPFNLIQHKARALKQAIAAIAAATNNESEAFRQAIAAATNNESEAFKQAIAAFTQVIAAFTQAIAVGTNNESEACKGVTAAVTNDCNQATNLGKQKKKNQDFKDKPHAFHT